MSKVNVRKHNGAMPKYAYSIEESLSDIFEYEEETVDPDTNNITGMIPWVFDNINELANTLDFDLYDAIKDDSKIFNNAKNRIDILAKSNIYDYVQIECMFGSGDSRHIGEVIQKAAMLPTGSKTANVYVAQSYPEWFNDAIHNSKTPTYAVTLTGNRANGLKFNLLYTNVDDEDTAEIVSQVHCIESMQPSKNKIKELLDEYNELFKDMRRHDASNYKLFVDNCLCVWLRINKESVCIQNITDAKKAKADNRCYTDTIDKSYNNLINKEDVKQKYDQLNPCIAKVIDIVDMNNISKAELAKISDTLTDFYNALTEAVK